MAVADVDGRGLENFPVGRLGQITQVVLGLRVIGLELFDDHMGRAVPHLSAGDMPVDDLHNGVVRMAAEVVDHYLAVAAELSCDPGRHLPQQFQLSAFDTKFPLFGVVFRTKLLIICFYHTIFFIESNRFFKKFFRFSHFLFDN